VMLRLESTVWRRVTNADDPVDREGWTEHSISLTFQKLNITTKAMQNRQELVPVE